MAKSIKPDQLGKALESQLTIYHDSVVEGIDSAGGEAIKKLVKLTKANAPEGHRRRYKKSITSKRLEKNKRGSKYVWFVKPPDHRLTHLLVHGHATKDGGRTKSNPFLANALDQVLPEYEEKVKEVISNG